MPILSDKFNPFNRSTASHQSSLWTSFALAWLLIGHKKSLWLDIDIKSIKKDGEFQNYCRRLKTALIDLIYRAESRLSPDFCLIGTCSFGKRYDCAALNLGVPSINFNLSSFFSIFIISFFLSFCLSFLICSKMKAGPATCTNFYLRHLKAATTTLIWTLTELAAIQLTSNLKS